MCQLELHSVQRMGILTINSGCRLPMYNSVRAATPPEVPLSHHRPAPPLRPREEVEARLQAVCCWRRLSVLVRGARPASRLPLGTRWGCPLGPKLKISVSTGLVNLAAEEVSTKVTHTFFPMFCLPIRMNVTSATELLGQPGSWAGPPWPTALSRCLMGTSHTKEQAFAARLLEVGGLPEHSPAYSDHDNEADKDVGPQEGPCPISETDPLTQTPYGCTGC